MSVQSVPLGAVGRGDRVSIPALDAEGRVIDVLGNHFDAVGVIVLDGSRRIRLALDHDGDDDADRGVIRVDEWEHGTYRERFECDRLERRDGRVVIPEGESDVGGPSGRRIGVSGA